jgi:hypothetical protein
MRSTDYKEHNKNRESAEQCVMGVLKARPSTHLILSAEA